MPLLPWIDPENFNPGYITRAIHLLPKRGNKPEWQHNQNYWSEKDEIPAIESLIEQLAGVTLPALSAAPGRPGALRLLRAEDLTNEESPATGAEEIS